jgi:hypothetical protein
MVVLYATKRSNRSEYPTLTELYVAHSQDLSECVELYDFITWTKIESLIIIANRIEIAELSDNETDVKAVQKEFVDRLNDCIRWSNIINKRFRI